MHVSLAPLALVALSLSTSALQEEPRGEWTRWRGPARDGVSPEKGWSSVGAKEDLWRAEVGRGYSCVCIHQGRLFTIGFDEGASEDVVTAFDAESGEILWTHAYPAKLWDNMHGGGSLSTPVAEDGRLYVMSRLGSLFCFDAATGKVLYERELVDREEGLGFFGLAAAPLILEDVLVLNPGPTIAIDKATGETRWETKDYGYAYSVPAPFRIGEEELLAVFNGTGLCVLEAATGEEIAVHPWTSEYNVNSATPIVIDDRIFISTGYNELGCAMLRLTPEGLEVEWESKAMNSKMNGCVLYDGLLYGFDDAILKCLTPDGDVRWIERGLGKGTVIAADDRLIVLSEDGELIVSAAGEDGFQEESRVKLFEDGVCWTTPVLSDGRIFCRSSLGELVARDHRARQ